MYKLLLCWRYLRTRYIALVCIVSVMLGVATMIVVNSVMAGFTHEMQARINGMLGDLIFESRSMDGVLDADAHMQKIKGIAGDSIIGMSPTVHVPGLMYIDINDQLLTRQITMVGIDEATYSSVSAFGDYLQHPKNREQLTFSLREGGYDTFDHQLPDQSEQQPRTQMEQAGWWYRKQKAMLKKQRQLITASPSTESEHKNPFGVPATDEGEGRDFDMATEQHVGIVMGIGVCGYRTADGSDHFVALPGDDVRVSFPAATLPPKAINEHYTITDFYESKMSEYDSSFVFVPLRALQKSRGMIDPTSGVGKFTSIQIKLAPGANAESVRDALQNAFPAQFYMVSTWRDKQGPLLAAVNMETAVLNVLLFMIIAVAGFGIFAIFLMIVVEKTRDIGILKSLGASGSGVMGIFLGYGLSLGIVGSGVGLLLGLSFVANINEIADLLGRITGQPVFDPSVYYFYKIPTIVAPFTVTWICVGAVLIAVLASVFPALRAANLHPVRALRYE
ncbi:ABC transporter permease [Bythopirellula polymerisocia]|uniref:Lipoprotein-releasing system transmembrane protein LolE n=1 Tax=Bythopirellula polymerisocia TaxID=2528003 RepID=A0A5C6CSW2_9BACT|nr:FtsX-like permease family protein [Bythopirellula polymerisocia]TWU25839.1 Lipoprotein-releasing system transmembrane protein LolE [Bythopirellula polymerisocia]